MQKLSRVLDLSVPIHSPMLISRLTPVHLRLAAVMVSLSWLSGCMLEPVKIDRAPPPDPTIIVQPVTVSASDAFQGFFLQAKKMSPAELAIEKERVRAEFNTDKSEYSRIKLALLLTLPAGNASAATLSADDAELAALVEPIAAAAGISTTGTTATGNGGESRASESELRVLALLIQASAQERKRLREQARDALSRTQVAKNESTKKDEEARILRTRVDELEKQLAALKSIERSVNSRTKERTDPVPKEGAPK